MGSRVLENLLFLGTQPHAVGKHELRGGQTQAIQILDIVRARQLAHEFHFALVFAGVGVNDGFLITGELFYFLKKMFRARHDKSGRERNANPVVFGAIPALVNLVGLIECGIGFFAEIGGRGFRMIHQAFAEACANTGVANRLANGLRVANRAHVGMQVVPEERSSWIPKSALV
jgi:hypothetical protein